MMILICVRDIFFKPQNGHEYLTIIYYILFIFRSQKIKTHQWPQVSRQVNYVISCVNAVRPLFRISEI